MASIIEKTAVPLSQLGIDSKEGANELFQELRQQFELDRHTQSDGESLRIKWLGRKNGILPRISENWLKQAPPELKSTTGMCFNILADEISGIIKLYLLIDDTWDINPSKFTSEQLEAYLAEKQMAREAAERDATRNQVDLSLPGVPRTIGTTHIIRQTISEIERIFLAIGFSVAEGPEIENTYFNFEALNIPEHHPARDDMDTFYIRGGTGPYPLLLRTHTSPVQIRTMQKQQPPVRIIVPGKVYRRDHPDATHGFMFHQVEGLAVDTDITFCDFKGVAEYFVREFLGPHVKTRLRPSYFQFTEPSAEVDGSCIFCKSAGCRICKFTGWIELFGAGMVDPAVYDFVNYDAQKLSGFAFGMGIDRLAMMKYGIDEVPRLFQNDVRFLRQFP